MDNKSNAKSRSKQNNTSICHCLRGWPAGWVVKTKFLSVICSIVLALIFNAAYGAQTYYYTGAPFTSFSGSGPAGNVLGVVTLDVPSNFSGKITTGAGISYTGYPWVNGSIALISDGYSVYGINNNGATGINNYDNSGGFLGGSAAIGSLGGSAGITGSFTLTNGSITSWYMQYDQANGAGLNFSLEIRIISTSGGYDEMEFWNNDYSPPYAISYNNSSGTWSSTQPDWAATISVLANPPQGGTVTGGGTFAVGSQVQISATVTNSFYTFAGWNDGNTANPRTITVPSGGVTYTADFTPTPVITFYHQPGDANNEAGHAFLSLTWKNGDSKFWGFYSTGWENEILGVTPGIVDGGEPNWDFSITYPITVVQYDAAATVITQDRISPPDYSLLTFNCMNWAIKVANAASVELPSSHDDAGFADPRTFGASLAAIGNGNTQYGGLVTESGAPDPPTPFDYSYSGLEDAGHTNAAGLATSIGLAYDPVNVGTVNANSVNGFSLSLVGPNTNQDLISMNWGDGSAFQEQSLTFSHVYSNGTYNADLLIIDAGAVHSYDMTVVVSSSSTTNVSINVTQFPPQSIPNQGFVTSSPVPDFNVVNTTCISILPNGQALIGFLGVSNWTYTIQATTNLTQAFLPIGSATAGSNGTFQYQDPTATNFHMRFYRASYP